MLVKVCEACKCGFTTLRSHARTCSPACRKALIRRREKSHRMRQEAQPSLFGQTPTADLIGQLERNAEFDSRDKSLDAPL